MFEAGPISLRGWARFNLCHSAFFFLLASFFLLCVFSLVCCSPLTCVILPGPFSPPSSFSLLLLARHEDLEDQCSVVSKRIRGQNNKGVSIGVDIGVNIGPFNAVSFLKEFVGKQHGPTGTAALLHLMLASPSANIIFYPRSSCDNIIVC